MLRTRAPRPRPCSPCPVSTSKFPWTTCSSRSNDLDCMPNCSPSTYSTLPRSSLSHPVQKGCTKVFAITSPSMPNTTNSALTRPPSSSRPTSSPSSPATRRRWKAHWNHPAPRANLSMGCSLVRSQLHTSEVKSKARTNPKREPIQRENEGRADCYRNVHFAASTADYCVDSGVGNKMFDLALP